MILLVFIGLSSAFYITNINIHGNNNLSNSQIINILEEENSNIFLFNINSALTNLHNNPYVHQATIVKDHINRQINVNIIERTQTGYVRFATDNYLRIDRDGIVMSTTDTIAEHVPVIVGLNFISFTLGEPIHDMNQQVFDIIAEFANIFFAYDIDPFFVTIDPTDLNNIRLIYGNIIVNLGSVSDLAEKFRIFVSISDAPEIYFHKQIGGQLNITNIYRNWTFNILT